MDDEDRRGINVSDCYLCKECGSSVFSHDVTEIFEERFDSKQKIVMEGKHYNDGDEWCCHECGASIPKEDISEFLSQMYDAST